jgi:glycosyltransferase involved in cell wall biosynthesis
MCGSSSARRRSTCSKNSGDPSGASAWISPQASRSQYVRTRSFCSTGLVEEVTVVATCFNYGQYVGEAVRSALDEGAHVVVVDDGSTEPLPPLPAEVELIRQENQGVARARNAGLARVETPYVLVLDADDRLAPGALAALRAPLEGDPQLGYAYGRMRFFGDWEGELRFPPFDPYTLLFRHTIGLSALARRQVFEDTGGFDPAFEQFEDWELWVNALAHGWHGRQVEAVTVEYRRHAGTKREADRALYRRMYRLLRTKHARLYADPPASRLGAPQRLWQRAFWGNRPIPARIETALQRRRWKVP